MLRIVRLMLCLASCAVLAGDEVRAQYYYPAGYGAAGYGFGGWGQTVQGSTAAGMGAFAAGAGQYNYQTAAARSINANTVMQWNNYVWSAQNSLNREHYARMQNERARNTQATDAIARRIREAPTDVDIRRGDALNAILAELTHPEFLQGSGLARSTTEIDAKLVRNIPFRYAPAMVVITIDRYRNDIPELLKSDAVKGEREAFKAALQPALDRIKAGEEVSPDDIQRVRTTGQALYKKVSTGTPGATTADRKAALDYLNSLRAFLKMLAKPEIAERLRELDRLQATTVGHLISFMHTYNLRFGPATTPEQVAAYNTLYPTLAAERDRLLGGRELSPARETAGRVPTELFQGIDPKHLDDTPAAP